MQSNAFTRPMSFTGTPAFTPATFTAQAQPTQVFVSQTRPAPAQPQTPQAQANQAAAGMAQMAGGQFEKAVSQVLTFFFGHKKDKTEEKEQRQRNELTMTDLMGERKVEQSNKPNLGGGQG